jgi:DNA-binding FadR family transcriptional regulator
VAKAVRGDNLTRSIVLDLGSAIVTGKYEADAFPTEKDLCLQYGAARTVLREAVKMLTAKGLLSARPRRGTRVEAEDHWNLLDPDVLRWLLERKAATDLLMEFTEMRLAVEPIAAGLAARRGTPEQKAAIAEALERMRAAEHGEGDTLEADIGFHLAILDATGNRFYRQLKGMIETALRISIQRTNRLMGIEKSETEVHSTVAEAILAGDEPGSQARMRKLIPDLVDLLEAEAEAQRRAGGGPDEFRTISSKGMVTR